LSLAGSVAKVVTVGRVGGNRWTTVGAAISLALGTAATVAAASTAPLATTSAKVLRTYHCSGKQSTVTDTNTGAVQNGGTPPVLDTHQRAYCVLSITTYHWNNGQGATPGTVGLTVLSGLGGVGRTLGPLQAVGSSGQGGAKNVNWTASFQTAPQPVVIRGRYQCDDSDPATWSQDPATHGRGFCTVVLEPAVLATAPKPATPTFTCMGPQVTLFNSSNVFGVLNGGSPPSFTTANAKYPGVQFWCLNQITTYHWNNGAGSTPGTIGLGSTLLSLYPGVSGTVTPIKATGSSGQGGAQNVNWTVNFPATKPVVIAGGYYCKDSDPATWSQNQQSGGKGFCSVTATPAYLNLTLHTGAHVPAPTAPSTPAPSGASPAGGSACSANTYGEPIVYPNQATPGGATSVLLACGTKLANSFQGLMNPLLVFTVPVGCLNGVPPTSAPYITYGTGPGTVNPMSCPNSINQIGWMPVAGNPLALNITAPAAAGHYLVFVRTTRGDVGTASILNVS
jgi:hypothetical protein